MNNLQSKDTIIRLLVQDDLKTKQLFFRKYRNERNLRFIFRRDTDGNKKSFHVKVTDIMNKIYPLSTS